MNKYSLIFVGKNTREIANIVCENEEKAKDLAMQKIQKFCEDRDFHIYYTRVWKDNKITVFDVGSHTEFFHLKQEE